MTAFIVIQASWRNSSWTTVEARVIRNEPGCVISYLPSGSLAYHDGEVVPCNSDPETFDLPPGATNPRIRKGWVGRLEYISNGRNVVKEGWLGDIAAQAVAGETIRLLQDPANPVHLDYGGKYKGIGGALAIIAFCFTVFGLYIYLFWILPRRRPT